MELTSAGRATAEIVFEHLSTASRGFAKGVDAIPAGTYTPPFETLGPTPFMTMKVDGGSVLQGVRHLEDFGLTRMLPEPVQANLNAEAARLRGHFEVIHSDAKADYKAMLGPSARFFTEVGNAADEALKGLRANA